MGNVILIGYMGCGKSTIGVKLSYRLQQPFLDTDKMIETKEERSIAQIFDTDGEERFRQMETECIRGLLEEKKWYVIATGGGLPVMKRNRAILKQLGKVIYLRVRPDTVYERLKNDKSRPLLRGENPMKKITEMIQMRAPAYEAAADAVIDVDGKSFEEILSEIEEKVT